MKDVYVPLDLATSDLQQEKAEETYLNTQKCCVILAGPGAGKSTIVKHKILEQLDRDGPLPFLVRLREYSPENSVDEHLGAQLSSHGVPDPRLVLTQNLRQFNSLCVLDGLDEVRPNLAQSVYDRINSFYQQFFRGQPGNLIVTCRKEAYRNLPLDIRAIFEVRPLTDQQIQRFAERWPLPYPSGKNTNTFISDLFETNRIHELARSPLLLVGGLMQYTESNRGVPDERVQYLERVGQWLVSEWAAAQDHPLDKYRVVYARILSRLAFQMQRAERPEILTAEAEKLIASWLPEYGFQQNEGGAVLSSIKTKTGILVGDLPQAVVFSQFGLQEYYASIDLLDRIPDEDELLRLSKEVWWREPLLLAIAQQKEPSPYLVRLFRGNPLLAAEAVAECPTPPLAFQEQAIDACINAIDHQLPAARSATVPLLRKIRDVQEERLIRELENRLAVEKTAQTAGLILAVVGTASATSALARHPSVWATCMQEAGYLSTSLENLLVGWIRSGDEAQSRHATDLLAGKLSADRFEQLIELLPTLPPPKADFVASMLLKDIADRSRGGRDEWVPLASHVSACVSRVNNPFDWARTNIKRNGYAHYYEPVEIVLAAVALRRAFPRMNAKALNRILLDSGTWVEGGRELTLWLASALAVAMFSSGRFSMGIVTGICLILVFLAVGRGGSYFRPLFPTFLVSRAIIGLPLACLLTLLGGFSFATVQGGVVFAGGVPFWRALALGGCCGLLGFALQLDRLSGMPGVAFCEASKWFRSARITAIGWLLIVGASIFGYSRAPAWPHAPVQLAAATISLFLLGLMAVLYRDYARAGSAAARLAVSLSAEGRLR